MQPSAPMPIPPAAPPITAKRPWYFNAALIIATLIVIAPVGIALMWWGKRFPLVVRIVLTVFFGFVFLSAMQSDGQRSTSTAATTDSAATEAAPSKAPEPAPAPRAPALNFGEQFRVGDFSYVVKEPQFRTSIGNEFVREKAAPNARFMVVRFIERNDGKRTKTGLNSPFRVRDQQGRQFEPSSRGETAVMMATGEGDFIAELQPGVQRDGVAVFEVPEDALRAGVDLVVKERGFLGSKEVRLPVAMK